jgi:hypothetical protein
VCVYNLGSFMHGVMVSASFWGCLYVEESDSRLGVGECVGPSAKRRWFCEP